MNPEDMLQRLTRFGRRLTTIADQIQAVAVHRGELLPGFYDD